MSPAAQKNPKKSPEAAELRRRAEEKHNLNHGEDATLRTELDSQRLVHELQVHQIELEMQNEELLQTRAQVEAGLQQYTDLYDFAPVGYFTLAKDGTIIQTNLKGASLLGMERARLVGRPLSQFVASLDRPLFNSFLRKVFETQVKESCEVSLCRDVNPLSSPLLTSPGNQDDSFQCVVRIEGVSAEDRQSCRAIMIDISERKRTEEEIRRLNAELELRVADRTRELLTANAQLSEEIIQRIEIQNSLAEERNLVATILNNANALIVVLDRDDRIVIFNQFCETLTGLKSQDVQGKSLFGLNLIPADELSPFQEFYFEFKQNSNTTKFYYENSWMGEDKRNHRIGWSAAAIDGTNGRLEFMVFLGLDLTENRSLRESLRTSEENYRKLFFNLPVSTLEVAFEKSRLVIVDANYQAFKTYGKLIDLSSKPFLSKIFAPDRKQDIETIKKQSNLMVRMAFESSNIRANGETFPVRINITFESELSSTHFILVIEDITSEMNRRSEEKAISEERARMAREIHDGVAQDLVTLIMRSYSWKVLIQQAPDALTGEIAFLQNLLNNDIQEVRRSIFALRPLSLISEGFYPSITRYVKDFGELNKITTHLLVGENLPVMVEELELSIFRMVQEGLNNIAKYAKANNAWIVIKNNLDQSITIEIKDDGVGFDIHDLKNMEHQGHFGISHMQERVRENQGKFIITSEKNMGVTIQINLPIREKLV